MLPKKAVPKKDIFTQSITGEEFGQINAYLNTSINKLIANDHLASFYQVQSEGKRHGEKSYELACPVKILS
jgi:hypothetical protein